jgi:hypothetical protein
MANCPYCNKPIPDKISRITECPSCGRQLHCCKCCTYYSPEAHYGCRETVDEPVWDKERANFCDYFKLKATSSNQQPTKQDEEAQKSRDALAKLFSI